ncbi:hypothetical protein [Candidatus Frankia alpina]|uniref:hypothetical protein n=1 Tax=Candidatus Frankia alpina TaxID=2699483 RepID=UPI0013D878AA|nr:hypothetical protein [Candidatus Frankia alpina]
MPWVDPRILRKGDVVSPDFNPLRRIVVDHTGLSTLAAVIPDHNPDVPATTPVRVVAGTRLGTGKPDRLVLDTTSRVWRHDDDGR